MAGRINKINKNVVPQDFKMSLAMTDFIPVVFFGMSTLLIGRKLNSLLFSLGAAICMFSGVAKVLWKIIVVLKKKNIWSLFMQMRILMPIGFAAMLIGLIQRRNIISAAGILHAFFQMPSVIFFIAGILGMCLMFYYAFHFDGADAKSNWIEQMTNGAAQAAFFIGLLLVK